MINRKINSSVCVSWTSRVSVKNRYLTATIDWTIFMQVCLREANVGGTGSGNIVYRKCDDEDGAAGFTFFCPRWKQDSRMYSQPRRFFNHVSHDNSMSIPAFDHLYFSVKKITNRILLRSKNSLNLQKVITDQNITRKIEQKWYRIGNYILKIITDNFISRIILYPGMSKKISQAMLLYYCCKYCTRNVSKIVEKIEHEDDSFL